MTVSSKKKHDKDILLSYYEQYKHLLYYTAQSILHDSYRAEEAMQETFINLARYRERFMEVPENKRRSYLITIVKNQCYLMAEGAKRQKTVPLEETTVMELANYIDVETLVVANETKRRLKEALLSLADEDRQILILRYYHECKGTEIAEIMGISHGAARMRLHRAMKHLGEII